MNQEEFRELLRSDTPFYAEQVLKIAGADGDVVPLVPRKAQLDLDRALEQQHAAGLPMRAIILKARKLGFSTWVQAKQFQRATQHANHRALTVAHDSTTAAELHDMSETMYANLPSDPDLAFLKPPIANRRGSGTDRFIRFGQDVRSLREAGDRGLNSTISIDTASEVQAGRGFTYHSLHCSEVAFWNDKRKFTALLNAVPPIHGTMVVLESTANGFNHFKERWDRAVAGRSRYAWIFAPWHEEPTYRMDFVSPEERERFIATIGTGPYGAEEPDLIEQFKVTPEQLYWRRLMIADECSDDINDFHQEFPSTPEEAFVSSGRTVFAKTHIARVRDRTKVTDPSIPTAETPGPKRGELKGQNHLTRPTRAGTIDIPRSALWTPSSTGAWRVWEEPVLAETEQGDDLPNIPVGQYVVAADVAGGQSEDAAHNAIQVIDHRTREQVAEYKSQVDEADLALQVLLAGVYYNRAWLAPEITGGWGLSVARILALDYHYPRVYTRKSLEGVNQKRQDRLGFDTNTKTKPLIEANFRDLLKSGEHGIRSAALAAELGTYVVDDRNKSGPQEGSFSDLLMAYMIGQWLAHEIPYRARSSGGNVIQMSTHRSMQGARR